MSAESLRSGCSFCGHSVLAKWLAVAAVAVAAVAAVAVVVVVVVAAVVILEECNC